MQRSLESLTVTMYECRAATLLLVGKYKKGAGLVHLYRSSLPRACRTEDSRIVCHSFLVLCSSLRHPEHSLFPATFPSSKRATPTKARLARRSNRHTGHTHTIIPRPTSYNNYINTRMRNKTWLLVMCGHKQGNCRCVCVSA